MVRFQCTSCGTEIEADTSRAGLQVACGNCHMAQTVPLPEFLPRSACQGCQKELTLTADQAGQIVKCPKCGMANMAPTLSGAPAGCLGWIGLGMILIAGALVGLR